MMSKLPVALQLYTVRDELEKDFRATVAKVAEIGYSSVELAGTGGLSTSELSKLFDSLGLDVVGSHVSLQRLESSLESELDLHEALGAPYIICPYMPEKYRSPDAIGGTCETLNEIGAACRERGIGFCYHNHNFEFDTLYESQTLFDTIYDSTDPELVLGEVDVYWVKFAGYDPVSVINERPRRFPLVHLKDMTPGEPTFAEVGEGVIDMQPIFKASEANGAQWYIVEQDRCQRPTLESAKISFQNLRRMGKA
jgi:sugar phosphate isomerase/epimerase